MDVRFDDISNIMLHRYSYPKTEHVFSLRLYAPHVLCFDPPCKIG
jgi:hypothetical protein